MKYILIIITFFVISCKAQVVSLETMAQCQQENPPFPCPDNFTYVKDINNSLNKYAGIWKGLHDGKIYEIKLIKKENVDVDGIVKDDRLIGRLRITTIGNSPITIFDNFNELDDSMTNFGGLGFQKDLNYYKLAFLGSFTDVCLNSGTIYINVKPNQPNQMELFYLLDTDFYTKECPPTFQTTIPEKQNIYLTKQ